MGQKNSTFKNPYASEMISNDETTDTANQKLKIVLGKINDANYIIETSRNKRIRIKKKQENYKGNYKVIACIVIVILFAIADGVRDNLDNDDIFWSTYARYFGGFIVLGIIYHIYRKISFNKKINSLNSIISSKISLLEELNSEKKRLDKIFNNAAISKRKLAEKEKAIAEAKLLKKEKLVLKNTFDVDNNGVIDTIENSDFSSLIKKHQKIIASVSIEKSDDYMNKLIKLDNYISTKKDNLQLTYSSIINIDNIRDFNFSATVLINAAESYSLLIYNSLAYINSIVDADWYTYNIIYERFDKLNIFSTNLELEISAKLSTIGDGITELNKRVGELNYTLKSILNEISDMSIKINNSLKDLTHISEETNLNIDKNLRAVNSKLDTANVLNTINVIQNYSLNKKLG